MCSNKQTIRFNPPLFYKLFITLLFLLSSTFTLSANPSSPSLKDIVSADEITAAESKHIEQHQKPGVTPLSTVLAIRAAMANKDLTEAAKYVDMRYLADDIKAEGAAENLRKLGIIWNQQNILDLYNVSDLPEGLLDDNLPSYRDLIGIVQSKNGPVPVYLQRVPDQAGGKIWKISNATVAKVPMLWDEFGYSPYIEKLARFLPEFKIFHMSNWQFISFVFILVFTYFLTSLLKNIALILFPRRLENGDIYARFLGRSIRLFLFFILVDISSGYLGLSIYARAWFESGVLTHLAYLMLILGVLELYTALYIKKQQKLTQTTGLIRPLATTLKIIIVLLVLLNWFDSAGYNIATILTGLGIGSLAIALAAQKTLENVFGAFTIYIAKPIKPGDFCKFGDIVGIVEEIGLRSTRIRKLNRTVVHVPNSIFASQALENYSEIDRRLYLREFRFSLQTSSDQLRQLLINIRELLLCHERVLPEAVRARFEHIERDAFVVVVNCYVDTDCIIDFKAVTEDLNLYILDMIEGLGIQWAIHQQRVLMGKAEPVDENLINEAHLKMNNLREGNQLPFPEFDDADVASRENTLKYPREGSVLNTTKNLKSNPFFESGVSESQGIDGK